MTTLFVGRIVDESKEIVYDYFTFNVSDILIHNSLKFFIMSNPQCHKIMMLEMNYCFFLSISILLKESITNNVYKLKILFISLYNSLCTLCFQQPITLGICITCGWSLVRYENLEIVIFLINIKKTLKKIKLSLISSYKLACDWIL